MYGFILDALICYVYNKFYWDMDMVELIYLYPKCLELFTSLLYDILAVYSRIFR